MAIFSFRGPSLNTPHLRSKPLVLFAVLLLLFASWSCSHAPVRNSPPDPREASLHREAARSWDAFGEEEPWYERPEYGWLFAALIVLGIGIAIGAAIWISSGASGLTIAVRK